MDLIFGIERETHRMSPNGELSSRPQPADLSPPEFTKDFAETQLEIVTKPHGSIPKLLSELDYLTAAARSAVRPEILWPFSMPPRLASREIAIASLGAGRKAREAELYRRGLALRYGVARQMICGLHVNVSIGDGLASRIKTDFPFAQHEAGGRPSDAPYLRLARNLYEDLPHLILLTGASPLPGGLPIKGNSPAVSYRNSAYGYAGREFRPYLDLASVESYTAGLRRGLATESERFREFGLVRHGVPIQRNARVFQKEKEFYAPIRLKRTSRDKTNGLRALERHGIEYLELRFVDVDPFSAGGISAETLTLFALFIHDGLRRPSGPGSTRELGLHLDAAEEAAIMPPPALSGARERTAILSNADTQRIIRTRKRLESLRPLARSLDGETDAGGGPGYQDVLEEAIDRTLDPGRLPSARILEAFESSGKDWTLFGMEMAAAQASASEAYVAAAYDGAILMPPGTPCAPKAHTTIHSLERTPEGRTAAVERCPA